MCDNPTIFSLLQPLQLFNHANTCSNTMPVLILSLLSLARVNDQPPALRHNVIKPWKRWRFRAANVRISTIASMFRAKREKKSEGATNKNRTLQMSMKQRMRQPQLDQMSICQM